MTYYIFIKKKEAKMEKLCVEKTKYTLPASIGTSQTVVIKCL